MSTNSMPIHIAARRAFITAFKCASISTKECRRPSASYPFVALRPLLDRQQHAGHCTCGLQAKTRQTGSSLQFHLQAAWTVVEGLPLLSQPIRRVSR